VGLALGFSGAAYLIWVLVSGVSRLVIANHVAVAAQLGVDLPSITRAVHAVFAQGGFVLDIVGLLWLALSLVLVLHSSRQRIGISWAWASATGQSCLAAAGGTLVVWSAYQPSPGAVDGRSGTGAVLETLSRISLPVLVSVAVVLWVSFLIWLLVEASRLKRRGPTLRDSLRTNIYR
jgi:hypothetical protein